MITIKKLSHDSFHSNACDHLGVDVFDKFINLITPIDNLSNEVYEPLIIEIGNFRFKEIN